MGYTALPVEKAGLPKSMVLGGSAKQFTPAPEAVLEEG